MVLMLLLLAVHAHIGSTAAHQDFKPYWTAVTLMQLIVNTAITCGCSLCLGAWQAAASTGCVKAACEGFALQRAMLPSCYGMG
jgi:hypothetical protein